MLEDMLADYPGTVLLISHDRDFLDRLVSGVIVPEGDGRWTEYAGGYSDMLAQRGADLTRERRASRNRAKPPRRRRRRRAAGAGAAAPELQGQARARNAAARPSSPCRRRPPPCRPSSTIPASTRATAPVSRRSPPRSATLQHKIAAAEEQWLELEILREELAGQ